MSLLSNYTRNRTSAKKKHIQNIHIYTHTRVPPLVEAVKIGLVTGEMGPVLLDNFFPFVVVDVVPDEKTAASKNRSVHIQDALF